MRARREQYCQEVRARKDTVIFKGGGDEIHNTLSTGGSHGFGGVDWRTSVIALLYGALIVTIISMSFKLIFVSVVKGKGIIVRASPAVAANTVTKENYINALATNTPTQWDMYVRQYDPTQRLDTCGDDGYAAWQQQVVPDWTFSCKGDPRAVHRKWKRMIADTDQMIKGQTYMDRDMINLYENVIKPPIGYTRGIFYGPN